MNNKVKLAIAVAVGIVGGGLISTFGGSEAPKNALLGSSAPVGIEFPEWTRDGSAFRCKPGRRSDCHKYGRRRISALVSDQFRDWLCQIFV